MNWYKIAYIKKVPGLAPYKEPPKDNYASAFLDFEDQGYWWKTELEEVPLNRIENDPWNPERLKTAIQKLKATQKTTPVFLSYDEHSGKYKVSDGNHRTEAAKTLKYTHIPAFVSRKVFQKPPYDSRIDQERLKQIGWSLAYQVRHKKSVDFVDINLKEGGFDLKIETHNATNEWKYIIFAQKINNGLKIELNGQSFSGSIEQCSDWISSKIKGISDELV